MKQATMPLDRRPLGLAAVTVALAVACASPLWVHGRTTDAAAWRSLNEFEQTMLTFHRPGGLYERLTVDRTDATSLKPPDGPLRLRSVQ